ncbi:MAG: TolC family protein [Bacteroidetes bacterium]|nr:TolC family protein [Bacteroidota bacterium]
MKTIQVAAQQTFFLILIVFCLQFQASGQTNTRQITLAEAISTAKAQSPDALNAKQTYTNNYWEYRSYEASNLPALALTATLPNINQSITSQSVDGVQSYASYQYISAQANLALTQKIGITGGTLSLNSYLSGVHNANSPNPLPFLSYPVNIELNQPIFSYNPYRWDRKIQPLKYAKAKRKYIEDMEQVAITATNYFFSLLQAQVEKKIALTNLSNYDTLYRIAKGRYQLGKIAENELLKLELNTLQAQAAVENAELALENARFQFKSYVRLQDSTHIVLLPPGDIRFFKVDPLKAVNLANENSSSALDFKKRLIEAASAVNFAKTDGRFDANIHALIGLQQSGPTIPEAYINPADQRQVSLGVTIPIVDWGVAHGKIKMAQSQEDIVKNSVEQEAIDFQRNVYLKAVQFNMQQNQMTIAAKSDTVARKSYEVTKGRYLIGKMNDILDLNNAQIETDNSEKNYYFALHTFWRSYYELRKLTLFDFQTNEPLKFELRDYK